MANYYWEKVEKYRIDTQIEYQRMRVIEEIVRARGEDMSVDELKQILEGNPAEEK